MEIAIPPQLPRFVRALWLLILVPGLAAVIILVGITNTPLAPAIFVIPVCAAVAVYFYWRTPTTAANALHMTPEATELVAAQAQLTHLFEHSPVPYLRITRDGTVIQGNLAAVRLFATTTERVLELNVFEQVLSSDTMAVSVILGKLNSGVSVSDLELIIATTTGAERWVRLSVYVAGINATECLVTLVDITQQKRVDQAKSEFVALAAHQLRTPLAAIRWNMELFGNGMPDTVDAKLRGYVDKVSRNATRMVTLINDFLSVSKLETGTFEADPETVDFTQYLNEILEEFVAPINQKQLAVYLNTPPTPVSVTADGRLLHIMTSNLISNATKYTPAQGQIHIAYEQRGEQIVFTVKDTGIGIPISEQTQLFSKFYRATNARKHRAEGTGLGLYIVKQSAEIMGGDISMQSKEGEGSTFTATFPVVATTQVSERTTQ